MILPKLRDPRFITVRRGGESIEDLRAFFANDPYKREGLATHDFVEFSPVKSQPFLADWVA